MSASNSSLSNESNYSSQDDKRNHQRRRNPNCLMERECEYSNGTVIIKTVSKPWSPNRPRDVGLLDDELLSNEHEQYDSYAEACEADLALERVRALENLDIGSTHKKQRRHRKKAAKKKRLAADFRENVDGKSDVQAVNHEHVHTPFPSTSELPEQASSLIVPKPIAHPPSSESTSSQPALLSPDRASVDVPDQIAQNADFSNNLTELAYRFDGSLQITAASEGSSDNNCVVPPFSEEKLNDNDITVLVEIVDEENLIHDDMEMNAPVPADKMEPNLESSDDIVKQTKTDEAPAALEGTCQAHDKNSLVVDRNFSEDANVNESTLLAQPQKRSKSTAQPAKVLGSEKCESKVKPTKVLGSEECESKVKPTKVLGSEECESMVKPTKLLPSNKSESTVKPAKVLGSEESKSAGKSTKVNGSGKPESKVKPGAVAGSEADALPQTSQEAIDQMKMELVDKKGSEILTRLADEGVSIVSKRKGKGFTCRFYCKHCDVFRDLIDVCLRHMQTSEHLIHIKRQEIMRLISCLPTPTPAHLSALTRDLEDEFDQICLNKADYEARVSNVGIMEEKLKKASPVFKNLQLWMCGSTLSKLATKWSDVNVTMSIPRYENPARVLKAILDYCRGDDPDRIMKLEEHNFEASTPCLTVEMVNQPGVRYVMSFSYMANRITHMVLSWYSRNYPLVQKLAILFKHVAKIVHIANAAEGTLAPYCYHIMAVFFCQQKGYCHVVLPDVDFEEYADFDELMAELDEEPVPVKNSPSLGKAWIELLKFYILEFKMAQKVVCIYSKMSITKGQRASNKKSLFIDDCVNKKMNVANTITHQLVREFILDKLRHLYLYFSIPQLPGCAAFTRLTDQPPESFVLQRKHTLDQTLDSHAHMQSRPESLGDQPESLTETLDQSEPPKLESSLHDLLEKNNLKPSHQNPDLETNESVPAKPLDKILESESDEESEPPKLESSLPDLPEKTNLKPLDKISDFELDRASEPPKLESSLPDLPKKTNLKPLDKCSDLESDELQPPKTFEQILDLALDRESEPPKLESSLPDLPEKTNLKLLDKSPDLESAKQSELPKSLDQFRGLESQPPTFESSPPDLPEKTNLKPLDKVPYLKNKDLKVGKTIVPSEVKTAQPALSTQTRPKQPALSDAMLDYLKSLTCGELVFSLNMAVEWCAKYKETGNRPPKYCKLCQASGHLIDTCNTDKLPTCLPLPPPSEQHLQLLSSLLTDIKESNALSRSDESLRNYLVSSLECTLRMTFPDAVLALFGSSRNGFGLATSDLDICLTFANSPSFTKKDTSMVIKQLVRILLNLPDYVNIHPIPWAKVPIVKFDNGLYNLSGDISLYNILAQRNTALLKRYSEVDERVRIMVYCIKEFAKICDIGDASQGSLSSYAHTLMVLHYLQQCDPPVIPVLQELYPEEQGKPEEIVEGWNTWFFSDDNDELAKVWPGFKENTTSIAELWIGYFEYYATCFDYRRHVVCITQLQRLTKLEKLWPAEKLGIEDPFDLNHNLGRGLSKRVTMHILRIFIRCRSHFACAVPSDLSQPLYRYLFNNAALTGDDKVAKVKSCLKCGKIGHKAKSCPILELKETRYPPWPRGAGARNPHQHMRQRAQALSNQAHPPLPNQPNPRACFQTPPRKGGTGPFVGRGRGRGRAQSHKQEVRKPGPGSVSFNTPQRNVGACYNPAAHTAEQAEIVKQLIADPTPIRNQLLQIPPNDNSSNQHSTYRKPTSYVVDSKHQRVVSKKVAKGNRLSVAQKLEQQPPTKENSQNGTLRLPPSHTWENSSLRDKHT